MVPSAAYDLGDRPFFRHRFSVFLDVESIFYKVDHIGRIDSIAYREIGHDPDETPVFPELDVRKTVESPRCYPVGNFRADEPVHAIRHLACSASRECEKKYRFRPYPLLKHVGRAIDDRPRLSAPRSGNDKNWSRECENRGTLRRIELTFVNFFDLTFFQNRSIRRPLFDPLDDSSQLAVTCPVGTVEFRKFILRSGYNRIIL